MPFAPAASKLEVMRVVILASLLVPIWACGDGSGPGVGLRFERVWAGGPYTCGVNTAGAAYCWGFNRAGELGDGTTVGRLVPTPVEGALRFLGVSTTGA